MDVYELSVDGSKQLIRTGRFPDGKFKIQLESGKNYELLIEKAGFISNAFQIANTKPNSLARLFFLKEMKDEYLYAQKGEMLKNDVEIESENSEIDDDLNMPDGDEEGDEEVIIHKGRERIIKLLVRI